MACEDLAREALEPFAMTVDHLDDLPEGHSLPLIRSESDPRVIDYYNVGDLRRARTAYDAIGFGAKAEPEAFAYEILLHDGSWSPRLSYSHPHAPHGGEIRNVRALSTHTAAGAGPMGEAVAWRDLREHFEIAHGLIQEAKGVGDGFVTDHLDAAENHLDAIEEAVRPLYAVPVEEPGEVERITRQRDEARAELAAYQHKQEHEAFNGLMTGPDPARIWKQQAVQFAHNLDIAEAALADTRERLEKVEARVDAAYDRCIKLAERSGSPEIAAKIAEEKGWDGLDCACGGGWKVGHLAGCPEAEARAALTGDAQEAGK